MNTVLGNIKKNTDFSPELVSEIVGNIAKQQYQTNGYVSQLDISGHNFAGNQVQPNIGADGRETQGWFHKAVGVSFIDYISCCSSNKDSYNLNLRN